MTSLLTCLTWVQLTLIPTPKLFFHAEFSPWLYVIPFAGIAFIIYYRKNRSSTQFIEEEDLPDSQPNFKEVVEFNRYAGGHPEINELVHPCVIQITQGAIQVCKYMDGSRNQVCCVGSIPMDSVTEIRVEDVFTMKRRMTPESWRISRKYFEGLNHKKGNEVAFTVIEWVKDDEHRSTYLCIEDDFAMEIAVKKRNAVLQKTRVQALQMA